MKLKSLWVPLLLILCSANSLQLTRRDIRPSMQEMLNYHVEYKEFSPQIARRSLKIFIEQFDPEKLYLTSEDVKSYLEPKEERLKTVIQGFKRDDFSVYEALSETLHKSVLRAKKYRTELSKELVFSEAELQASKGETYLDYAKSDAELKTRIQKQLVRLMLSEKRTSGLKKWGPDERNRVFVLWEKRFQRIEAPYLLVDASGKPLLQVTKDQYLAMHALKAFAKSLDAHTSYYTPHEAHELRASLEKQFEGVGVVLREGIDGVSIVELIKGGPAERAGKIQSGDLIVEIDSQSMANASYEEVLAKLQSSGQSKVNLGFKRTLNDGSEQFYSVDLVRERIVMQDERLQYSYEPYADGIIGKLTLPSFYESSDESSCEKDMREALRALKQKGKLLGIVLDMRENSGGFLNQAVKVSGLFISSGVVVISKYSQGEVQYLRDLDPRSYYNGPLVILTSRASASAAEIVAQALQDWGTALVIGDDRTYGKGTIQYQTVTDPGAPSYFKVTVGRYYTVSGRSTQIEGVQADIVVPTYYSNARIGERYLEFPLKSDRIPAAYIDPLTDVDQRNRMWFQHNYLPNLQKKISLWTQMLPQLKLNSAYRLEENKDYTLFLQALDDERSGASFTLSPKDNWGIDDLQLIESVNILKDMVILQQQATAKKE